MRSHTCDTELELIYTSDGETLQCPECKREWIAVLASADSSNGENS